MIKEIKIRFTENLYKQLNDMSFKAEIDLNVLIGRALRKWNRVVNNLNHLESIELPKSKNLAPRTFRIDETLIGDKTPMQIKKIITWYLTDQKAKSKPFIPLDIEKEQESMERDQKNLKRLASALANY